MPVALAMLAIVWVAQAVAPGAPASTRPATEPIPRLQGLPPAGAIQTLEVIAQPGGAISLGDVDAMLRSGRILAADDPTIRDWAYSPLCHGSFRSGQRVFTFRLYRGGMATIEADAQTAFVRFELAP
jgi:hypothetical protein